VRDDGPPDNSDPHSNGWGPIRGSVPYVLSGKTVTFQIPASVLNVQGPFGYTLELMVYGADSFEPYTGRSGGLIFVPEIPRIVSVSPADGATGVSRSNCVVFAFNVPMDSIYTRAYFDGPYTSMWNSNSTVLTCTTTAPWPANNTVTWYLSGRDASRFGLPL